MRKMPVDSRQLRGRVVVGGPPHEVKSGYRYRLFNSRTKSASLDGHMYVCGWLLCCHEPQYLQDSLHQALSGPDQDDIFCQDLIHCSGR